MARNPAREGFWLLAAIVTGALPLEASVAELEILLTTAASLPAAARAAMVEEAEAIWRQHGVTITWLAPTDPREKAPHRLRAMVVERRALAGKAEGPFAIGELVRASDSHPVALVSIEGAQRLVRSTRGTSGIELAALEERRVGIALGRALAHEIGHFLLGTHTHARDGLMRPRFNALEFTDLRDGTFALDRDAEDWLRTRDVEKFATPGKKDHHRGHRDRREEKSLLFVFSVCSVV